MTTLSWKQIDASNSCYLFGETTTFVLKSKIACFDIDSTIIKTKSGKTFATNKNDWIFFNDNVPKKLQKIKKTHSIIFITNQSGLKSKEKMDDWQQKISDVCKKLNVNLRVYCSIQKDVFRKPCPTFINMIKSELDKKLDYESYYCGDAAGRKNDFSDTDYKFAVNANLEFYVPEQIFCDEEYDTSQICTTYINHDKKDKKNKKFIPETKKKELILMVGFPGSGKSKYVVENIVPHGYIRINQDTLKTKQKCIKETKNAIINKKNIVIDNLNYDIKTRKEYIDIAKSNNYNVRCLIMTTSRALSIHNMLHRTYISNGAVNRIQDVVYNMMSKNYVKPTIDEGIDNILDIHFVKPTNAEYKMFFS